MRPPASTARAGPSSRGSTTPGACHGHGVARVGREAGRPTCALFALEELSGGTRASLVARAAHEVVTLDAAVIKDAGATARAWPLVDLDAPGAFDAALALAAGVLVYDDAGATPGERRVRKMAIAW